ncbi:MAG: DUF362 domain-containing protein, partial [Spirochaetaceae bacterium]|nr:DUF362 domain-containing protein [Spirochaetaceae bacterium]
MKRTSIRESLKTSVFRDLPLKNARFAAQRARNCKGTAKNNRFLEVPIIFVSAVLVLVSFLGCTGNNAQNQVYASVASGGNELSMDNEVIEAAAPAQKPAVYFTADISPKGMMAVYNALNTKPKGKVAVKITTGEPPKSNYLRPELIKDLVQSVQGTIVECNTAYGGKRASNAMHLQVAKDHGFT